MVDYRMGIHLQEISHLQRIFLIYFLGKAFFKTRFFYCSVLRCKLIFLVQKIVSDVIARPEFVSFPNLPIDKFAQLAQLFILGEILFFELTDLFGQNFIDLNVYPLFGSHDTAQQGNEVLIFSFHIYLFL